MLPRHLRPVRPKLDWNYRDVLWAMLAGIFYAMNRTTRGAVPGLRTGEMNKGYAGDWLFERAEL